MAANNYAHTLVELRRFEEARVLMRKTIPVSLRVLGCPDTLKLTMRKICAMALYKDDGATLEDLREVVTMLEDAERTARRVLGGTHPLTSQIEQHLPNARDTLRERETSSGMATRTRAARARPTEEK